MPNKNGRDEYGNDGFIAIGISKEARDGGDQGEIIGNWKTVESTQAKPSSRPAPVKSVDPDLDAPEEYDIPFRTILQNLKNFFRGYSSTRANAH